ncbi:MAG: 2-C-methyl-D-erythritol 4-phosphate cytidylyltransferase [Ruminococcaceae bacterium]|nr:2-C-methyl-D-erythritol 4-phosphate cytidylyltransferase [Oscillospiraceae bacterium]
MNFPELIHKVVDKIKHRDAAARPFCTAVVPAAGSSTRMAGENKQFSTLMGIPVLAHTLRNLENCPVVDEIIVATKSEEIPAVAKLADEYGITKLSKVVMGGASRGESAYLGALACSDRTRLIAVHDGARPLGSSEMIARVIELAAKTGAAVVTVPVKDTIKMMSPEGYIDHTPQRDMLRAAQTPQVFDADILRAAYAKAMEYGIDYTDDCAAVEALGKHIYICDGENTNLKITTPDDLILAQAILEARTC